MPINTLQMRGRQIGEIRLGIQVPTKNGKTRPEKLEAFRFTTKSESIARAVAHLFGGEAQAAILMNRDKTFEVVTNATEVPVMVPPGDNVISQWMELYTRGGRQRQCDTETEQLSQTPCQCPFDQAERQEMAKTGKACKPVTRLNVMLPDLPDLGVWLLKSSGWNAAEELGGTAQVLAAARASDVIIPATLRLEQRQKVKDGETFKFAVPVLELRSTLRDLAALESGGSVRAALPEPPPQTMQALSAPVTPTVDMKLWIHSVLGDDEPAAAALGEQWKKAFTFTSTEVPASKEQAVRALVNSFRNTPDDEPLEAEIVEHYPEPSPAQRSEQGAEPNNLDSGRPF